MNQLENTVTSLEVAEMVRKNHKEVLRNIRRIIDQIDERKNALVGYFTEDTYKDGKGEIRPCYRLTKKGCELFSTRMTGAKGTQFAVAYIERFNQMEQHIKQTDYSNLSPELQMFNQMFQAVANQEQRLVEVNDKVDNISNIVALNVTDWRKESQKIIRAIGYKIGGGTAYQEISKEIYAEVDRRAGSSLKTRLTNMRRVMAEEGVSKSKRSGLNYLDVIDKDKRLKEIYIAVVKDFAIKYQVEVA